MRHNVVYIVEGETECKLLEALRTELKCIYAGKILKHNVVQDVVKKNNFLCFSRNTMFVLVFDTDTDGVAVLNQNIELLSGLPNAKEVITIPQVQNLEDELCYSCRIRDIRELTRSKSQSDVKRDLLRLSNLGMRLEQSGFDIARLWSRHAQAEFADIENNADRIKILKK